VKTSRLPIAILWHQHQPMYRARQGGNPRGSYMLPWVRLHAVRDYYAMAALVREYPNVHVTINLVPSLIDQIEDYTDRGATDVWQELALKPTHELADAERDFIVARFFDASWENEITIHPAYSRLLNIRRARGTFTDEDITDLKVWFNLAWFPNAAHHGPIELVTGETVDVSRLVKKAVRFSQGDVEQVLSEQHKLMRAVLPLHRQMMEDGQLEISVTPFYHPILPLVADTDLATIDAEGSTLPERFHHPEDAEAQIRKAVAFYEEKFGRAPRGMWPSEGSVGQHVAVMFADAGLSWIATDQGVLARSGKWGYEVDKPQVLAKPYRVGEKGREVAAFFRHTKLSDDIGFTMQGYADYDRAADDYLEWVRGGYANAIKRRGDHILSIVLDGENAWGSYRNRGTAFLRGIYARLNDDPDLISVTFSEYLDGNAKRGIRAHPTAKLEAARPLYCASWIDEMGSHDGNDLNIWVGSPQENRAWELLGRVRAHLDDVGATPETHPDAFEAVYRAEGSDWFWWFGDDFVQPTGGELQFDRIFREHLKDVYRALGEESPAELDEPIADDIVIWSAEDPAATVRPGQILRIMAGASGTVEWTTDDWMNVTRTPLVPAGDVMSNRIGYAAGLTPIPEDASTVRFRIHLGSDDISGDIGEQAVSVAS